MTFKCVFLLVIMFTQLNAFILPEKTLQKILQENPEVLNNLKTEDMTIERPSLSDLFKEAFRRTEEFFKNVLQSIKTSINEVSSRFHHFTFRKFSEDVSSSMSKFIEIMKIHTVSLGKWYNQHLQPKGIHGM